MELGPVSAGAFLRQFPDVDSWPRRRVDPASSNDRVDPRPSAALGGGYAPSQPIGSSAPIGPAIEKRLVQITARATPARVRGRVSEAGGSPRTERFCRWRPTSQLHRSCLVARALREKGLRRAPDVTWIKKPRRAGRTTSRGAEGDCWVAAEMKPCAAILVPREADHKSCRTVSREPSQTAFA
jgi:hypothetical protein